VTGGKRRRPGFVTIDRQAIAGLRARVRNRTVLWTLLELIMEADYKTGALTGSRRALAARLGISRNTLDQHIASLVEENLITVENGKNQYEETRITILEYDFIVGVAGSVGGSVAGSVGGSTSGPADTVPPVAERPLELPERQERQDNCSPLPPKGGERRADEKIRDKEREVDPLASPLYAALAAVLGYEPKTRPERRTWRRGIGTLADAGATPDLIREAADAWPETWEALTLNALARHFGALLSGRLRKLTVAEQAYRSRGGVSR
jgi:hypothetical protein